MRETNKQQGGDHYRKCGIEPVEYIHANNLDFFRGNVVKYVTRDKYKNGAEDILKAIDYLNMVLEMDYGYKNGEKHMGLNAISGELVYPQDANPNLKKKGLTQREINDLSK